MKIFLIPSPLGELSNPYFAESILEIIRTTDYYFVENERTARRFIGSLNTGRAVQELILFRLTKRTDFREVSTQFLEIPENSNVGVISEAGCPGIADPGALVVQYAHKKGYEVEPIPGPSSIFMALMASGFNGQQFAFHGYLPQDSKQRQQTITQLEGQAKRFGQTQIFMETPYRNKAMIEDVLKACSPHTSLCIAAGIHTEKQFILTRTVEEWRKKGVPNLHKIPTVFVMSCST